MAGLTTVALTAARASSRRAGLTQMKQQTRGLRKNAHVEAWDGYRADNHKRFQVTAGNTPALLLWGIMVPCLLFAVTDAEEGVKGHHAYVENKLKQEKKDYALQYGLEESSDEE